MRPRQRQRTRESILAIYLPFPLSKLGEISEKRCSSRIVKDIWSLNFRSGSIYYGIFIRFPIPNWNFSPLNGSLFFFVLGERFKKKKKRLKSSKKIKNSPLRKSNTVS
ncbi:hypothetical protein RDI58_002701 [Solanum bulbocastanum]|uniref:Uncharacterized protein n=1 Tax=Solanum bulbocastanum TaxID=147425 RepID=A0AAN8YUD2_SOLBU